MLERVVLAVDGSAPSDRATAVAADIAKGFGSELIVINVRETEIFWRGAVELETPDEASELVDETVRRLKDAGISARGEVHPAIYGRAARVILELASEEGADLIVLGSRGLSDLAGLVLGSVTHKVLHLAHCPVLVVR
jgi:nucleotide-binding universal stress UspA family protein